MIPGGVSFQPGQEDPFKKAEAQGKPSGNQEGVQQAIKVLSLRLPKVVGAQAAAPTALLRSEGSGGNPRVDSIVAQVMQKYFPTNDAPQPQAEAPGAPPPMQDTAPQFGGGIRREQTSVDRHGAPRVIVGGPPPEYQGIGGPTQRYDNQPSWDGGQPFFGGMIDTLPDLRKQLDWLPQPDRNDSPVI